MSIASMKALGELCRDLPVGDEAAASDAKARQDTLTKPRGSLGRLEELVIWLARWQGKSMPALDQVDILIFAGSHGVTARGVSAFPPEVTAQMVANYANGGAAINQLALIGNARLKVIPLSIECPTADICIAPAMSETEFLDAVQVGFDSVDPTCNLCCLGEMGIGNTTIAAAVCLGLFGGSAKDWTGLGTGVNDAGLLHKIKVIETAVAFHQDRLAGQFDDPLMIFAALGGRELAAIFGAVLACRIHKIPVIIDGFVATTAVAPLAKITPAGLDHVICGQLSAEQAHRALLSRLAMSPLLDLGMRLGEGSGAALAINIVRAALACHTGMATFTGAGVSGALPHTPPKD